MDTTQPETSASTPQERASLFFSLRWKILLGFTLVFTIVFAAAFYWFLDFSTKSAMQKIQDDLEGTILGASQEINGDDLVVLAESGEPNAAGFSDDPRYESYMDWLDTVHAVETRAWPYLFVVGDSKTEGIFIADLWARYEPDRAVPFQVSFDTGRDVPGINGLEFRLDDDGQFDIYEDDWGQWVSAYAPVSGSDGEPVGAIGIDFEANYVQQVRQQILNTIAAAFTITYLALFALVFLVTGAIYQPILKLTRIAEQIGEGNYEQDFSGIQQTRFRDEIGTLSATLETMVGKVYQREQTLRHQVERLKIQIDETKRHYQVSEIVETDFFRDLQARADQMRRRRSLPRSERGGGEAGSEIGGEET